MQLFPLIKILFLLQGYYYIPKGQNIKGIRDHFLGFHVLFSIYKEGIMN